LRDGRAAHQVGGARPAFGCRGHQWGHDRAPVQDETMAGCGDRTVCVMPAHPVRQEARKGAQRDGAHRRVRHHRPAARPPRGTGAGRHNRPAEGAGMKRAVLLPARWIGPAVIYGLVGAWAVLWFAAEPPGQPAVAYLGQFFGAESVLLLSIGMVLISTLPWCEA